MVIKQKDPLEEVEENLKEVRKMIARMKELDEIEFKGEAESSPETH